VHFYPSTVASFGLGEYCNIRGLAEMAPLQPNTGGAARVHEWMRRVFGIDRAIGFTVLARFWASAAGLVTVALIARFLSPAQQGYYYTFGSLVALQIVFELGFSFVILQLASHERAELQISDDYEINGSSIARSRLASVIQKSVRWYSVAAVLMASTLLPSGFYFFSTHQHAGQVVSWQLPWCSAALMAAINFQLDPFLSFLEGCGYVAQVARLRLVQSVIGSLLAWIALISGHGLFAPSMMLFGMASGTFIWLTGKRKLLLGLLRHPVASHSIDWSEEVWPFQWRIALSWLSGYFLFWIFNPVLFAYRGPVEAGKMGMSLSLANAIQAIAISWVSTKSAPFGTLIARREYRRLDKTFFQALRQSSTVSVAGALSAWLGCIYLHIRHFGFAQRLLDPMPLGVLLLYMIVNVVIAAQAYYLRAHKQEVLFVNSLVGAIAVTACTFIFGRRYGAAGIVVSTCFLNFGGLVWSTYKFRKYRRLWHVSEDRSPQDSFCRAES
jgi:O-antigen/teichoic acid export membrane protein